MIYLDYNSTTPAAPEVIKIVADNMNQFFANPASINHYEGIKSYNNLNESREIIAQFIGGNKEHIYFNSGASESNNTLFRAISAYFANKGKVHIITSMIEHKCILNVCAYLEKIGIEISYIPVSSSGIICLDSLRQAIKPHTRLISIMAANNETGVLQPLAEINHIAKQFGILFHTDAAQILGKLPFNLEQLDIDFASISAHKFYGPNGVGALYGKHPAILSSYPLIYGGGQESGIRSGTVNIAGIAGMAKAAEICMTQSSQNNQNKMMAMKQAFIDELLTTTDKVTINGDRYNSLPNTINLSFLGVKNSTLLKKLKMQLALSSASACSSNDQRASHVLSAMGLNEDSIQGAIRLSFGLYTTKEDLKNALRLLVNTAEKLRSS